MPAVLVSQEDADRMSAYEADCRNLFIGGTSGSTPALPSQFTATTYDGEGNSAGAFGNFMKVTALALFRLLKNGPSKFPAQFPSYLKTAMPPAAANVGSQIFVTNDIGGAVPAFSDGVNWRRVTDRQVIS